jgi:hypothetical protein
MTTQAKMEVKQEPEIKMEDEGEDREHQEKPPLLIAPN